MLWSAGFALSLAVAWFSPWSPFALSRADVLLGEGRTSEALTHYDAISRGNPIPWLRHQALRRAAVLWAVDGSSPSEAKARLERLAESGAPLAVRAQALEDLGRVLMGDLDRPADASDAFLAAYRLDKDDERAGDRLVEAARSRAADGDLDAAHLLWDRVARRFPAHRALARVSQAGILLGKGQVERALRAFQEAVEHSDDDNLQHVARLGAATCMERLGDLDAAIVEIVSSDLPEDVEEELVDGIVSRRAGSSSAE